jgi:hypothetical protein
MATCVKCGAALISLARFCATCGSPVTRGSIPPAAEPQKSAVVSVPDPFARTVLGENVAGLIEAAHASPVSPMAASLMKSQGSAPPPPSPASRPPVAYTPQPYAAPPQAPAQPAQPVPQPMHNIPPGTLVLVYWADGQRYPGTVLQVSPQHLFVAFPNGIQQWIDVRYITVGG